MNIFTRKKTLLAEIANLNEQIRIQSREMASLRKADAKIKELKDTIASLMQKQNYKARPKGPSNPLNL